MPNGDYEPIGYQWNLRVRYATLEHIAADTTHTEEERARFRQAAESAYLTGMVPCDADVQEIPMLVVPTKGVAA